MDRRYQR